MLAPVVIQKPKVDPKVWQAAAKSSVVPVFLVLKRQPQREIIARAHDAVKLELSLAEGRHQEIANRPGAKAGDVRAAQQRVDDIVLLARQRGARESEAETKPELDALTAKIEALGATRVQRYVFISMLAAEVPASAISDLQKLDEIGEISLVERSDAQLVHSVPALGAAPLWNANVFGTGQSVAVLDTGVAADHPAFGGRVISASFVAANLFNCIFGDNPFSSRDFVGHGTHVAGIIGSQGMLGWPGRIGVAPQATIFNFKVGCNTDPFGLPEFDMRDVADGIDKVFQLTPAKVVNLSLAGLALSDDGVFAREVDYYAERFNTLIVVAAGNYGPTVRTLSNFSHAYNAVSVANANSRTTTNPGSSRGPTVGGRKKPDLTAPGTSIYSAAHNWSGGFFGSNPDFVPLSGTSMAAPHIAGAALLLRELGVTDAKALKALLINTTDFVSWNNAAGWGFANIARLFERRDPYYLHSVGPADAADAYQLYRGSSNNNGIVATLAWNRFVSQAGAAVLHDLDLLLYSQSGQLLMESASRIDNVEQVFRLNEPVNWVLKVRSRTAPFSFTFTAEPFALAISDRSAATASGPRLVTSCSAPASVQADFDVACTVRNTGDLPAFAVAAALNYTGRSDAQPTALGRIDPGASVTDSWRVPLPPPGSVGLTYTAASNSFGELFRASSALTVNSGQPGGCSFDVNPRSLTLPAGGGTASITISTAPGCQWSAFTVLPWVTLTGSPGVGPGGAGIQVAANSGSLRTGTVTVAGLAVTITQQGTAGPSTSGLRFVPVAPCRVADTRPGEGKTGAFGPPAVPAAGIRDIPIPQAACGIPATALAYSLNFTVVPEGPTLQFITAWPAGQPRPVASTLNSFDGKIVANAAILPAGTGGAVSVFASNATHIIVDINGYFTP